MKSKGSAVRAAIIFAFVLSGVGAFHGFSSEYAEASETAIVYDNENLIAAGLDSSKAQLELGPGMFQSHEKEMRAIPLGQENLQIYREKEPMPMGSGFGDDILVYGSDNDDTGPRIAANPIDNSLWVVFTHFNGADDDVYLFNSRDAGSTWNHVLYTTGAHNERNPSIAIMGNTIMIAYEQDAVGWEQRTYFIRSQNGGLDWDGFFVNWDWTNESGYLQLEDFNNPDLSISRAGWFHWTADAFGVRNNTRTIALMWTDDDGDSWWMVYWMAFWHLGEDFEHPVIMENSADNYMHMAWQQWNSTTGDYDINWYTVDHGLTDLSGRWTADLDGGNSEIAPDIWIRDDRVFLVWQNGSDLTGFYSDDGGTTASLLYITGNTPWNETYPSCFVDTNYEFHVAFSNDTVLSYGNTSDPLSEPFETYTVSVNSSTAQQYRTLGMFLHSGFPLFVWTDLRNSNPDIYFVGVVLNNPPVAVASPTYQEVSVSDTAWLYGNESYDVGGWIVNYSWYIEGPSATIQLYGAIVSFVPPEEGGYLANLTVTDNGGAQGYDTCIITVIGEKLNATIDFDPDTLNLKSKGRWATVYIELPNGYDVEDIDASTVLLEDTISPVLIEKYGFVVHIPSYIVDHDGDGIMERMLKFSRSEIHAIVSPGTYNFKVTGELEDGMEFEGFSDPIRVIYPGKKMNQTKLIRERPSGSHSDLGIPTQVPISHDVSLIGSSENVMNHHARTSHPQSVAPAQPCPATMRESFKD